MKKRYWKYISPLVCITMLLIVFGVMAVPSKAEASEAVIIGILDKLHVTDAEFLGEFTWDNADMGKYKLYHSNITGYDYYFDADTGDLSRFVLSSNSTTSEYNLDAKADDTEILSDNDRRTFIMDYVSNNLPFELLGKLEIEAENFNGFSYHYKIHEVYDGIETGTIIVTSCSQYGKIKYCNFTKGGIFRKTEDGEVTLTKDYSFISGDAALSAAKESFDVIKEIIPRNFTLIDGSEKVELKAHGNSLFYLIVIQTLEDTEYPSEIVFEIDAYTAELIDYYYAQ